MDKNCDLSCRRNKVGGQAVLEGVMMKAGTRTVTSCRKDDGTIVVFDDVFESVRKKHKILNIPIIRGVVNFFEMMKLSVKTLEKSAEAGELEMQISTIEQILALRTADAAGAENSQTWTLRLRSALVPRTLPFLRFTLKTAPDGNSGAIAFASRILKSNGRRSAAGSGMTRSGP